MQPALDFRGYLQQAAPSYLAFTGNDAKIDPTKAGYETPVASYVNSAANRGTVQSQVDALYQKYLTGSNPTSGPNLIGASAPSYAVAPPNWDLTSIYNQAGSQAAGQVNPYYTKQLQDFQTNQANAKVLQDQQRQLTLQNAQKNLDNTLGQNDLSRGRTSQDVLTNEQQIGQAADIRQQDQGTQFDQARIAQAKQLAQGGLTGSGLGNQQVLQSTTDRNTQEARQDAQDTQQVAAQELTKARTFEDLANSDVLSKFNEGQTEKQTQIDWDKFVQGQASDLQNTQQTLEQQRLAQLSSVQKQLAQQQVNDMIHNLSNPQQRLAAAQAYGGSF